MSRWSKWGKPAVVVVLLGALAGGQGGPSGNPRVGIAPQGSSAVESGHVIKASGGNLYTVLATATANGVVMVFDSATVPGDGAVTPLYCIPLAISNGSGVAGIDFGQGPPGVFVNGVAVAYSTGTNCASKTASATAWFTWRVQ